MKIGIIVESLGASQLAYYLIKSINRFLQERFDHDILVFYESPAQPCYLPNFATMNINQAWFYDGVAVATSLSNLDKMLRFPRIRERYFYSFDLEWTRINPKSYEPLCSLYCHKQLGIIARSDSHAQAIEKAWNVKTIGSVEDCNIHRIIEIVESRQRVLPERILSKRS